MRSAIRRNFYRLTTHWQAPQRRLLFTGGVLGLIFLLRVALDPWLAPGQGLVLLVLAPFLITLVAGLALGILAGVVTFVAAWFFFLVPHSGLPLSADAGMILSVHTAATVLCVAIAHVLRTRLARLETEKSQSNKLAEYLAVFIEAIPTGILSVNAQGRISTLNKRLAGQFGYGRDELVNQPFATLLTAEFRGSAHNGIGVLPQRADTHAERGELAGLTREGREFPIEVCFNDFVWDGKPMKLASVIDITERKRAEEREKLLVHELRHRSRNLISVVQALAVGTFREDCSVDQALRIFCKRLEALVRADRWLDTAGEQGVNVREIVVAELGPFGDQIVSDGLDFTLSPLAAQNLAVALHELATNAAKYGALSCPQGKVTVRWSVARDNGAATMRMHWHEAGGPPVRLPTRHGFGSTLIDTVLKNNRINYASDGLSLDAELPPSRAPRFTS